MVSNNVKDNSIADKHLEAIASQHNLRELISPLIKTAGEEIPYIEYTTIIRVPENYANNMPPLFTVNEKDKITVIVK